LVEVFDDRSTTPGDPVWSSGIIDPTTVYSDVLVYDDASNLLGDSGGRNFLYVLHADDYLLLGGRTYIVQVHSTSSQDDFVDVYQVIVHEVRGS
jgi:hypothetical protein